MSKKDLKGMSFGKWKVLCEVSHSSHRSWKCLCECGNEVNVLQTHLVSGKSKGCIKCANIGKESSCFTGYEEIRGTMFTAIQKGAVKRGYKFDVTIEELWELYLKQDKKCALSGIDIEFGYSSKRGSCSLDRIDSNQGYVKDNIQWVHKDVNIMKNNYSQEYFIEICRKIANMN